MKHWHGATAESWMSHIAISTNIQAGEAEWLEPVSNEDYKQLK
jgi:quercetin dioxygenase-like cupin family protein